MNGIFKLINLIPILIFIFLIAVNNGHSDVVKELIRANANLNIKDNDGTTALIYGELLSIELKFLKNMT